MSLVTERQTVEEHRADMKEIDEIVRSQMARGFVKFAATIGVVLALQLGTGIWLLSNIDTRVNNIETTRNTHGEGLKRDAEIASIQAALFDQKELQREIITRQRVVENTLTKLVIQVQTLNTNLVNKRDVED